MPAHVAPMPADPPAADPSVAEAADAIDAADVWDHLQNAGGCTFHEGTNPLCDLAIDVCVTLGGFTPKGECLGVMVDLYDAYYARRACTLRDLGVEYAPPPDAPESVKDLFANRFGFLWQADLERAMTDAVVWSMHDVTTA